MSEEDQELQIVAELVENDELRDRVLTAFRSGGIDEAKGAFEKSLSAEEITAVDEWCEEQLEQTELFELAEDIFACLMVIPFLDEKFIALPKEDGSNWKHKLFLWEYYSLIVANAGVQGIILIYVRLIWADAKVENGECGSPDNTKNLRYVCIMCYIGYVMADLLQTYTMILWLWTIAGVPFSCACVESVLKSAEEATAVDYRIIDAEESIDNKKTIIIARNLKNMSSFQRFFLYFVVIGFKIGVAFALIGYGSGYVIASASDADIILNALALCFILELDGMVYEMFVSQEYKAVMEDDAPRVEMKIASGGDKMKLASIPIKIFLLVGGTYVENMIYCSENE